VSAQEIQSKVFFLHDYLYDFFFIIFNDSQSILKFTLVSLYYISRYMIESIYNLQLQSLIIQTQASTLLII